MYNLTVVAWLCAIVGAGPQNVVDLLRWVLTQRGNNEQNTKLVLLSSSQLLDDLI